MKPCPKPVKRGKKYVPPRARVKKELYTVMSLLVRWRDGGCVQRNSGRGKCWGNMTDGHIIVRAEYGVTFDLMNNHCQCEGHQIWHRYHWTDYEDWFISEFGIVAWETLKCKARSCEGEKSVSTPDLEALLAHYKHLWDTRPAVYDRDALIRLGYFGWYFPDMLRMAVAVRKEG
jgi:hypothetical protein